jgi:hypothetical protein
MERVCGRGGIRKSCGKVLDENRKRMEDQGEIKSSRCKPDTRAREVKSPKLKVEG